MKIIEKYKNWDFKWITIILFLISIILLNIGINIWIALCQNEKINDIKSDIKEQRTDIEKQNISINTISDNIETIANQLQIDNIKIINN